MNEIAQQYREILNKDTLEMLNKCDMGIDLNQDLVSKVLNIVSRFHDRYEMTKGELQKIFTCKELILIYASLNGYLYQPHSGVPEQEVLRFIIESFYRYENINEQFSEELKEQILTKVNRLTDFQAHIIMVEICEKCDVVQVNFADLFSRFKPIDYNMSENR